jgi:hypothetical protein
MGEVMKKPSQKELDPRNTQLLTQAEELRNHLLGNDCIRESVLLRAYELFEVRGAGHGRDLEDWVKAENEVLSPLIEEKLKISSPQASEGPAKNVTPAKQLGRKSN